MTEPDAPSATGVRRRRAKRGEGARLREELLAAARQLLDERGESAVTVRAVAQRVGVSTPAVYLHFASRTELLHGVCRGVWDRLDAYMAEAAAAAEDPFEELRRRCAAYIRFGLDHPLHYGLVAAAPRRRPPPRSPTPASASSTAPSGAASTPHCSRGTASP